MKWIKLITIFSFLMGCGESFAQTAVIPVYSCENPGVNAITSGLKSSNYLQGIVPLCTVTVYLTGTTTKATIYKDSVGTPQNNPLTASSNGSIQPIYAIAMACYDVQLSGGILPSIYSSPVTITGVCNGGTQNVLQYPGADLGAKITAADTALGSNCGTLEVPPDQPGLAVTTAPTISTCHTLWLRSPITWSAAPTIASGSTIKGDGASAIQTLPAGLWIYGTSLSNVTVYGLWVTNPNTTNTANLMFQCATCNEITVHHIHSLSESIITTTSIASSYASVNSGNVSTDISSHDNYLDGQGDAINLETFVYTQHVTASNNTTKNAEYGTEWWGGDANVNGALVNTRWTQDINITNSIDINVVAGQWGSMGQDVAVTGATVDGCSDVGLDAEGSFRVVFTGFTVHNCTNGGLATFYGSQHVTFGPGTVTSDTPSYQLFHIYNNSNDPTFSADIDIHNIKFVCGSTSSILCGGFLEASGGLFIHDNTFLNSVIGTSSINTSGFKIQDNQLYFTFIPSATFSAIDMINQIFNYSPDSWVSRNTIISTVTQSSGSYGIKIVSNDFNASDTTFVEGNTTSGFTNDVLLNAASSNIGITPIFIFSANNWGNNSVTETVTGAHGKFVGSTYNSTTDKTTYTGSVQAVTITDGTCSISGGVLTGCTANGPLTGNITLTTATSDAITISGVTTNSKCGILGTNATAASVNATLAPYYTVTVNTFTLNHVATSAAGATYGVMCSIN